MSQATAQRNAIAEFFAANNVPPIGHYWEGQGGVNCGLVYENGRPTAFLLRSFDFGNRLEWGGYGTRIDGANDCRDGRVNTKALLASGKKHPAAQWAAAHSKDGHSDFYLPAQFELNQIAIACMEDMPDDWFWSSTQYSADYAWLQGFGDGLQGSHDKDGSNRAVAVRRLVI